MSPADPEIEDKELYKFLRDHARCEKRDRLKANTAELERRKIPFAAKNDGVHLIIADRWDFWPSTGKWFDRTRMKRGHDLQPLLSSITAVLPGYK